MTHVLLVGAFGQGNPGDDALCAAFRRAVHGSELTIATRAHGGVAADGVTLISPAPHHVLRALRHTDVVVIGGGTVFKRLHPSAGRAANSLLRSTAALVAAARLRGARVALVGVGAGELSGREAKGLARWIVRHSDLLVLRDEESAAVLSAAGAVAPFRIGADPAWTLTSAPEPHRTDRTSAVAVTVAVSHLAGDGTLVDRLASALVPLAETRPIRLQPWQVGGDGRDARVARDLAARIGHGASVVAPPADLADAVDGYRHDRLVVALRFHALLAAGAAGTPVLAIAHEPKLGGLARRLGQPAVPPHASAEVLRRAVSEALQHPPATAPAVTGEMARAAQGMSLLQLLLDRGATDEPASILSPPLSSGAGWW